MSYILVTPYTIVKSRTGGVLARLLSRSGLELVGAQMFAPDENFIKTYAGLLKKRAAPNRSFLGEYVEQHMAPSGGRRHRSLFLLFKGENTCDKLAAICGHLYPEHRPVDALNGETIRDTYADLLVSPDNPEEFTFFEPAVITPRSEVEAEEDLRLFAPMLEKSDNIIDNLTHPDPSKIERTLVIIKPDNWTFHSARPGTIIDMLSQSGLRIVGIKVHYFSLEEALDFYGPVKGALKAKLAPVFGKKAREILEHDLGFQLSDAAETALSDSVGAEYALDQFYRIVDFMSGHRPDRPESRPVKCMIVVYEGVNAVGKIRDILGATDPTKARDGTIRKEFGSNVMVNAAHASDSVESFVREKEIVRVCHNSTAKIIKEFLTGCSA